MLGTEPEIIANYVESGQVRIIFWPVLNHGDPSVFSTLAAECAGQQDPDLFWQLHTYLFENQRDLWSANRDYYVNAAVGVGADETAFAACYDGPDGLATIMSLDALRRERGVFSQPTFDINGQIVAGARSFDSFADIFDQLN